MEKLSLEYIVREPNLKSEKTSLLILLHGYGSNEEDLFSFATELPEDLIISEYSSISSSLKAT